MARRRDETGPQQYVLEEPKPTEPVVRVRCPRCAKKLRVRVVHVGKKVRCPKCRKTVKVIPSDDIENLGEMMMVRSARAGAGSGPWGRRPTGS